MKHWTKSKTILFNAFTGIMAILAIPEVVDVIPPEYLPYVMMANALGNFYLRSITNTGITR